jgi:C4-dicarboxylate-specific signal transduction histidine kinase
MGQLATSLAHELTQPLGAILRNAEAAEMFLQSPQPDLGELKAIVADIRKDDERAGGVIDRMRALLKRRSIETATLDLRELLEDTVALARIDGDSRKVKLELHVPSSSVVVSGDRIHLQQVLLNLILNGMDAMNECDVEDRKLNIRLDEVSGNRWRVSVKDRGTGIASASTSRVFQPFFTTKPKGLGMGLAISKAIVEAHGGEIAAGNNSDRGATFSFTIPAEPKIGEPRNDNIQAATKPDGVR